MIYEFIFISEDELYENLRGRFLHHGRGRPKMLPPIDHVSNKLLVQLAYLKEEGQKPDRVVCFLLLKLFVFSYFITGRDKDGCQQDEFNFI